MAYNASAFGSGGSGGAAARGLLASRASSSANGAAAQAATSSPSFGDPGNSLGGVKTPPAAPPPSVVPPTAAPAAPQGGLAGLPAFLRDLPTSPPAFPAGSTDPAYLAFQRQYAYQTQLAEQNAARQYQLLAQQMLLGPQQLAEQGVISRRNISGGDEARGIYRSGERLQSLADERTAEAQKLAALRLAGSGQYGSIVEQLQQTLAGLSNQAAEQQLAVGLRTGA